MSRRFLARTNPTRRGFSLIEILIVVAIVAAIGALLLAALAGMGREADKQQMATVLRSLAGIETEYRAQIGTVITFNGKPVPNEEYASIKTFVEAVQQVPDCENMLAGLGSLYFDEDDDGDRDSVIEVWEDDEGNPRPVQYRSASNAEQPYQGEPGALPRRGTYSDGPTRPGEPKPYFASPGPDGEWGDPESDDPDALAAAEDNMYSYDMD